MTEHDDMPSVDDAGVGILRSGRKRRSRSIHL